LHCLAHSSYIRVNTYCPYYRKSNDIIFDTIARGDLFGKYCDVLKTSSEYIESTGYDINDIIYSLKNISHTKKYNSALYETLVIQLATYFIRYMLVYKYPKFYVAEYEKYKWLSEYLIDGFALYHIDYIDYIDGLLEPTLQSSKDFLDLLYSKYRTIQPAHIDNAL